jgi:hypothetical protein
MGTLARRLVALDDVLPVRFDGWYDSIAAQPTWQGRFEALERMPAAGSRECGPS